MFESYNSYIDGSFEIKLQKQGNLLVFDLQTVAKVLIPSGVWTTIGVLKKEYRPINISSAFGSTGGVQYPVWMYISTDGTVKVYQSSRSKQQCCAQFIYFTN